jgi:hypothetical protein
MFERYTEKARRAIFFARYDASQYGSYYTSGALPAGPSSLPTSVRKN